MVTAKSYFSGAGGMDLGLLEAGISIIESFEIDKKCCDTLNRNDNDAYRQIGNAVAVPMGRWVGQQIVRYFSKAA